MDSLSQLFSFDPLLLVKIIILIFILIIIIISFMFVIQIRSLNKVVTILASFSSSILQTAAIIYFIALVSLFFISLVIL